MVEHIRIKPDKCKACRRCEVACIAAHHDISFKEAMKQKDVLASRAHVVKADGVKTSVRCHQCDPAPCCNICPTHALQQDEDGRIRMNEEQCVACKMCVSACPYGAISMDVMRPVINAGEETLPASSEPRRQVAVRCDMCYAWRMENGKKITACMEACPVRALYMVEADGTLVEAPEPEKKAPKQAAQEQASV